jgi:hypothetical protein
MNVLQVWRGNSDYFDKNARVDVSYFFNTPRRIQEQKSFEHKTVEIDKFQSSVYKKVIAQTCRKKTSSK